MLEIMIIILAVLIDQVVKLAVVGSMTLGETVAIWQDVFHLTYIQNRGAAFSMMEGNLTLFYIITPIAIGVFGYYIWKIRKEHGRKSLPPFARAQIVSISMIVGGTIGNFLDRVQYQYVIDMFDFRLINFPVFNVADIFLTLGTILLIGLLIKEIVEEVKHGKENAEPSETQNNQDANIKE